jgi:hypothetical protein
LFLQQGSSRIGQFGQELCTHGATQLPLVHVAGLVQTLPQPPQLLLSVCSLTQSLPQTLYPELQLIEHAAGLPEQTAEPLDGGAGQTVPHVLQSLVLLVVFTHVPLQSVGVADGQAQLPLWHVSPPLHTCPDPQPPQLLLSVCSLTQAPLQAVKPVLHWKVHALVTHAAEAFATPVVQVFPHEPQSFALLVVLTHVEPQSVGVPVGHPDTHEPPEHTGVPPLHP